MKFFSLFSVMLMSLSTVSSPAFAQDEGMIEGTYKLQSWRHDLGRPALYSYSETAALAKQCHAKYIFDGNGAGSFTGADCQEWNFQWQSKGPSKHEWISGVLPCEKFELSYSGGGYKDSVCLDDAGVMRGGSDKFGQPLAYTKKEIR
jgi:hypothetical protein